MIDNHPPFQIDGNFGGTAGIAEMLLHSHAGEVNLLPCLPDELPAGKVEGLMVRGGHEISIQWENGALSGASIKARLGNPIKVRCRDKVVEFSPEKGEIIVLNAGLETLE